MIGDKGKILLLGASGGCGRWIAKLASVRGYEVRAVVRPKTEYTPPAGVEVVWDSILDQSIFDELLQDCRYVVSALGIKRKNPMNPWSSLDSPELLVTTVMEHLLNSSNITHIQKVIAISAAGVGESIGQVHPLIRWMIKNSNMAYSYQDLEAMEKALAQRDLDWAALRPVTLRDGDPNGSSGELSYYKLTSSITRGEVARQILDALDNLDHFSCRTPMIG